MTASFGPLDLPLTAAEAEAVARAAAFAQRAIAPLGDGPLPRALLDEYAGLGLAALQLAPAQGGIGGSYFAKIRVAEAIAAVNWPAAFALNLMQGGASRLATEGSADQAARYLSGLASGRRICVPSLSEPGAGSDFAAIATHAEPAPGGWVLTGEKAWVTLGRYADLLVCYAQTETGAGARGIASFLVDLHAPGVERLPAPVEGGAALAVATIRLSGVFVPEADVFAPPGLAFKRGLRGVTGARVHVAAMICATAEAALRTATAYAQSRHAFGRPLLGHQGLRWQLAEVALELEAARLLTYRAVHTVAAGQDALTEAAFAKLHAARMAARVIPACMQAMGGEGLHPRHGLARHLLATRMAACADGTDEMQMDRIGAALAGRYGEAKDP